VWARPAERGSALWAVDHNHRLRARLVERFPAEVNAIDRYFALVHETVAATHDFFAGKAFPPLIGAMVMPLARGRFFRLSDRTTREGLSR
jgi:hypothetical protein